MAKKAATGSWPYVLKQDRELPPEEQSRFILRPLTHDERAVLWDDMARVSRNNGTEVVTTSGNQKRLATFLSHVDSIENFPAGAPIPWPEKPDERLKYLDMLLADWVLEVGDAIWNRSALETDVKNS